MEGGKDTAACGAAQMKLRLPQDLRDWLKHRAIDNRRTVNSEVLARLEQSREAQEERHAKAPA